MKLDLLISYLNNNVSDWEVYIESTESISAEIDKGSLKVINSLKDFGYSIRVLKDGKIGFSASDDPNAILDVADNAIKLSKLSGKRLKNFPVGNSSKVTGIFDKRFNDITPDVLADQVDVLVNSALAVGKVNPAKGKIIFSKLNVKILNSSGTELEYTSTYSEASLEVVFDKYYGFEIDQSRLTDLNLEKVGRNAAKLAMESSNPIKIEKGFYNVVLTPIAVDQLFYYSFYPAILANNVIKGRSPLIGKTGEKIGNLTIIDDGTMNGGLNTVPFDDEGVKSRKKIILNKGELKTYLFDLENAELMNCSSTGNGFRDDYATYPSPQPSNVILDFDTKSQDLYDDRVILIHSFIGSHTANPVSGDFSLEAMNAFIIKGGDKIPLKEIMIYDNIYNLIKKIDVFGKDVRQVNCTVSPSIRFKDIKILS